MPYEKIGKNEPVCIADEVPFEIPDSWEWVRLGKIVYNRGQMKPIDDFCYIDIGLLITKIKNLMMKNLLSLQIKHHQGQEKLLLLVILFILLYVHICIICALLIDPLAINLLLVLALRHLLVTLGFTISSCFII